MFLTILLGTTLFFDVLFNGMNENPSWIYISFILFGYAHVTVPFTLTVMSSIHMIVKFRKKNKIYLWEWALLVMSVLLTVIGFSLNI